MLFDDILPGLLAPEAHICTAIALLKTKRFIISEVTSVINCATIITRLMISSKGNYEDKGSTIQKTDLLNFLSN